VHELGLRFFYLLNGRCTHLDFEDSRIRSALFADVEWIVETVRADVVIVADLRIAKLIRQRYSASQLGIRVSTIAGVTTPTELEPWLAFGIDGVVLHHDVGRNFALLKQFVCELSKTAPGVEIELLLNESCLHGCSARDAHYARLAREKLGYVEGFQQNCNLPKLRDPSLILSARWIRPEDISMYFDLGIKRFKIAGREMPAVWLDNTVSAYLAGKYEGNLIDLLTMTPPGLAATAAEIVFLNNSALNGFLGDIQNWPRHERPVCRDWAKRLWEHGEFAIRDPGSTYEVSEGVRCSRPGQHLQRLIELQGESDPEFLKRKPLAKQLIRIMP
jgi:collagenase-like PrtC family protease